MIKVKANEILFNRFNYLANKLSFMGSIVQNDMDITEEQLDEFHVMMNVLLCDLEKLESSVGLHINECNTSEVDDD